MKIFIVILLALAFKSYAEANSGSVKESRRQINTQKEWNDMVKDKDVKSQWKSAASSLSDANQYKIKVTRRIQMSNVLRNMQNIKEKLYKLADEKLEKCVSPLRQDLDKHCVGRAAAQIMQLISALENSGRHESYTGDNRRRKERSYLNI